MRPLPTLRQLTYLVAVAEHRHFGRAADECLVTQSTLSAGIRELEAVLGVTLFERSTRNASLTPMGESIVECARAVLRAAHALADTADAGIEPLTGLLRLGVIPTIAPYLLPQALPAVRAAHPRLRLFLREEQTARLLDLLVRDRLDAALMALPYQVHDLDTMVLGEDSLLVACPREHPLAALAAIDSAELATEPLLLLEDGHCLREHALTACRLAPGRSNEDLQATSLSTLIQMVANGLGITLIPAIAVDVETRRTPEIVVRPFSEPAPTRELALVWRTGSPRASELRLLGELFASSLQGTNGSDAGV